MFWLITCDMTPSCRRLGTATSSASKLIDGWITVLAPDRTGPMLKPER
jgi:hypothetical protein